MSQRTKKKSHPNITPIDDDSWKPAKDDPIKSRDENTVPAGFYMPTKKKSPVGKLLVGAIIIAAIGAGGYQGVKSLHIGQTECCDGSWSPSKGSGTCSHHGGIIGVGCRQCDDGTWSTAKGSGACSKHGGLKK